MESKKYLEKAGGDTEQAAALLYEKGISLAVKRTARLTKTGIVEAYVHAGSRIGVMLELRCETDFASSTEIFRNFARDMAMHIAAMSPSSIDDLLEQNYYRDTGKRVNEALLECIAALKENVEIRRFVRYEVGE
jgi:elongation factor Ts